MLLPNNVLSGCRTGNAGRDCHPVSPVAGSGNNTSRDVVIETVHARHADPLPPFTNNCVLVQGTSCSLRLNTINNNNNNKVNLYTAPKSKKSLGTAAFLLLGAVYKLTLLLLLDFLQCE